MYLKSLIKSSKRNRGVLYVYMEGSTQKEGKWQNVFDFQKKEAKKLTPLYMLHALLHKTRRNCPHKNQANAICLVFVWTVSVALRTNACKQNKVNAIASLMCKSYKLCHLPAFCVEPSIYPKWPYACMCMQLIVETFLATLDIDNQNN